MRILSSDDSCEYKGCTEPAYLLVYSRDSDEVLATCTDHAYDIAHEDNPEYTSICDNCQCLLPIN